jgi:hypothetical protein
VVVKQRGNDQAVLAVGKLTAERLLIGNSPSNDAEQQ